MTRKKRDPSLPKHCSWYTDRHGKKRLRHQLRGKTHYFKAELGSPEWLAEYRQYEGSQSATIERFPKGSFGDLISRYYRSQDFLSQGETSQNKVRAIIEAFRKGRDAWPVALADFEAIDEILARAAKKRKSADGKRMLGGPAAAQRLRKILMRLFRHAVRCKMITTNPVAETQAVTYKTKGHHTWTEDEIAAYQARHPLGTKARLALEIILWTGQRRGDAYRFGPAHVRKGKVDHVQEKTGKTIKLPIAPQLREAIDAMPAVGLEAFLVTEAGKPFSKAGFGNWFRDRCDEAGLYHCAAHGLRKAIARRLAQARATQQQIKAVGGWSNDAQVRIYTADAEQELLADDAFERLAEKHGLDNLPENNR